MLINCAAYESGRRVADVDLDRASVVYRRRGWSYGVLHLEVDRSAETPRPSSATSSRSRCPTSKSSRYTASTPSPSPSPSPSHTTT